MTEVGLQPPASESRQNSQKPKPSSMRRRILRGFVWLFWLGLSAVVAAAVAVYLTVAHFESGLPSVEQLRTNYRPPQVTRILARDGTVLSELFTERRTVIAFASVPNHAKLAFLAAEDAHFYEHEGLNYLGMLRAMLVNLRAGRTVQGGSTITQQVVKNVLLVPERTLARKIQETILARRLEQSLHKDEILNLYLNHIYLGHGRYGIEEAARLYFGKHASELGLAESALLAGIVASPERFSPRKDAPRALERRAFVLRQMRAKGFVANDAMERAINEPLNLAPLAEDESDLAPEAVAQARQLLEQLVGEPSRQGGYTVTTTIDTVLQAAARRAVLDNLRNYGKRYRLDAPFSAKSGPMWGRLSSSAPRRYHAAIGQVTAADDEKGTIEVRVGELVGKVKLTRAGWLNEKNLPPSKFAPVGSRLRVVLEGDPSTVMPELRLDPVPQSALVAIDVRSRQVLALVGSREALNGGLDRATQMKRQPGSSFKPFVYSYALSSRKFTLASQLIVPSKSDAEPSVALTIRDGLAKSENSIAEQLLGATGAINIVSWAKTMGIDSVLAPTLSLALGAYEVTPLEITNSYATFASGGIAASPVIVTRIVGPDGKEIPIPRAKEPRQVIPSEEAYLVTSLMRSVVDKGTAQRAKRLGRPVVGKTGTTNQAKDTWFVGYSPEIVAGVWVGFDDPISLGSNETGGGTALPAWVDFMKAALAGRPIVDFARPTGLEVVPIDPATGLLAAEEQADALEEVFLVGTAPTERAAVDAGVPEADGAVPVAEPSSPAQAHPPSEPSDPAGGVPTVPEDEPKEREPEREVADPPSAAD